MLKRHRGCACIYAAVLLTSVSTIGSCELRVFEVSFGAGVSELVRDSFGSGDGQFRSHAMVCFRPRPARIGLKLPTSPSESDRPVSRNWATKLPHSDPKPPAADPKLEPGSYGQRSTMSATVCCNTERTALTEVAPQATTD